MLRRMVIAMQVLIDIPEEDYNEIKEHENFIRRSGNTWKIAVLDGVVLPEKHGRLIDADAAKCSSCGKFGCENWDLCELFKAKTIIEADGGSEE